MDVIAGYAADLARTLRGPRRLRADLVAEARDGLTDAAEAYEHEGADPDTAARRAVADFGPLGTVASGYQAVLATAQARRTALLCFVVTAAQTLTATYTWRSLSTGWTFQPGVGYSVLARTVDWVGVGDKAAVLLVLLATGIGVRHLGNRPSICRFTGVLTLAVGAFMFVAGTLLTTLNPALVASYRDEPYLWFFGAISLLPGVWLALSARRCILAARPVPEVGEISPVACRSEVASFDE
ncbi:MAG TPA: permease prefix domain 1-containing protein [Streptosporangiales bacterium]